MSNEIQFQPIACGIIVIMRGSQAGQVGIFTDFNEE